MFGRNKDDRTRDHYVAAVRDLLATTFSLSKQHVAEQDRIWEAWLKSGECCHREWRDLIALLKTDVKDAFKARAIAILLVPRLDYVPFAWSDDFRVGNYLSMENPAFAGFSSELLRFAISLLEINIDTALVADADRDIHLTLYTYNRGILEALKVVPEDDPAANRLFERYQLNDPVPFSNTEDSSGYNPFRELLNSEVPEKWKRLADSRMREIVRAEQEGRASPRREWEQALPHYLGHIQMCLYSEPFPYSADLIASQLDFALSLPNSADQELIASYHLHQILALLHGAERKELCHRLARRVVLADYGDWRTFSVHSPETRAAAEAMLHGFGDEDPELGNRLRAILTEADAQDREQSAAANQHQAQADAVLAQMR